MILLTISYWPPNMLVTRSYLKKPIKPQLIAPMITKIRVKFLTDITPFRYDFAHFQEKYDIMNSNNCIYNFLNRKMRGEYAENGD